MHVYHVHLDVQLVVLQMFVQHVQLDMLKNKIQQHVLNVHLDVQHVITMQVINCNVMHVKIYII